jgi:hypothetical protein
MLSLVRSGPKILILESPRLAELEKILGELCGDKIVEHAKPREFVECADENMTILYIVSEMRDLLDLNDFVDMYVIDEEPLLILEKLYEEKARKAIKQVRLGPRLLIMKTIGEIDQIVKAVAVDYDGSVEATSQILQEHKGGTVVLFTKETINKSLEFHAIHKDAVYINRYFSEVIRHLSKHVYKYINAGLDYKDWNALTIKIYDSYEHYDLHYDRLVYVIEKLGLGLIIGETWGTDAATVFWSVGVYKVKLMTYYSVDTIKKILVGLEYLDDGKRIVDYDLFQKRKKIHWDDIRGNRRIGKKELGIELREAIKEKLTNEELKELKTMENTIIERTKNS